MAPYPSPADEPPLLERARRTGWGLLALALVAMLVARLLPGWKEAAWAVAATAALLGLLAVVNVALVRGLYRQLRDAAPPADDHSI